MAASPIGGSCQSLRHPDGGGPVHALESLGDGSDLGAAWPMIPGERRRQVTVLSSPNEGVRRRGKPAGRCEPGHTPPPSGSVGGVAIVINSCAGRREAIGTRIDVERPGVIGHSTPELWASSS